MFREGQNKKDIKIRIQFRFRKDGVMNEGEAV